MTTGFPINAKQLSIRTRRLAEIILSTQFSDSRLLLIRLPRIQLAQPLLALLKSLAFIIFLLNVRSLPGGWHWRLFWCVTKVRLSYLAMRFRARVNAGTRVLGFKPRLTLTGETEQWFNNITPIGVHPFEIETRYRTWVSLDESDFNMHKSNSSYPKILDCARMKAAMVMFPQFLRVGGVIPLASTHFHFVRELPVFAKYEVRLTIGAWDEKWMYVVGRFVTKSKKPDCEETTLHTVCVSRVCFKIGRITVPPAIVMATNGVSVYPWELSGASDGEATREKYSSTNPPPTWTNNALPLWAQSAGGSARKLREFYKGAWRKELEGKTENEAPWWEVALGQSGGPVDARRKEQLEACQKLVGGMDGLREIVI